MADNEVSQPTESEPTAMPGASDPAADGAVSAQVDTEGKGGWWRGVVEFVVAFVIMIGAIMALRTFVIEPFQIPSGSMLNTIEIGDRIFAEKITVAIDSMPSQGEIVTFVNPRDHSETLIKRVVAVGGQTIDLRDGVVYIDGEPLDEPYTNGQATKAMKSDLSYEGAVIGIDADGNAVLNETGERTGVQITYPYTVPEGYFWAMGDNRGNSADSRVFGAVDAQSVTGHAVFRYWPIFRSGSDGFELAIGPLD